MLLFLRYIIFLVCLIMVDGFDDKKNLVGIGRLLLVMKVWDCDW